MDIQNIKEKSYKNSGNEDVLKWLNKTGRVLDIGCGAGDNAKVLKPLGYEIDGITISETELKEALPFLRKGFLFNLENGLPEEVKNEQYDYVICSHVLEHICYPENLLRDIKNCLSKDGILIVALPNLFHYKSRIELIKGNFNYAPSGIWDNTHFKWYTFLTGKSLLENNGYLIVNATVTGDLPGNSFFSKIFSQNVSQKIFDILKKISKGLFGFQLLYIAKKN